MGPEFERFNGFIELAVLFDPVRHPSTTGAATEPIATPGS